VVLAAAAMRLYRVIHRRSISALARLAASGERGENLGPLMRMGLDADRPFGSVREPP
jgi:hypothetical protein